jgi:hypothetical protein
MGGFPDFMSLMFGGFPPGMGFPTGNNKDEQFVENVGDQRQLASCMHDDLPAGLPIGGTGFDMAYKLLV